MSSSTGQERVEEIVKKPFEFRTLAERVTVIEWNVERIREQLDRIESRLSAVYFNT